MKLIKKLLMLSAEIYKEPRIGKVFKNDTDYCEVIKEGTTLIVVFRGTENKKGWKSNFECVDRNSNDIHDGFEEAYNELDLYYPLVKILEDKSFNHVIFTGHSRGGPLAIQAAFDMSEFGVVYEKVSCVTFGTPRLGGKKWRDKFNRSKVYLTRVETPGDPVCNIPLKIQGYIKEGNILTLKLPWYLRLTGLPFIRAIQHSPKVYMKAIEYTERN